MLFKKNIIDNDICEICNNATESAEHIICDCNLASQLWQRIGFDNASAGLDGIHTWVPPATVKTLPPS